MNLLDTLWCICKGLLIVLGLISLSVIGTLLALICITFLPIVGIVFVVILILFLAYEIGKDIGG